MVFSKDQQRDWTSEEDGKHSELGNAGGELPQNRRSSSANALDALEKGRLSFQATTTGLPALTYRNSLLSDRFNVVMDVLKQASFNGKKGSAKPSAPLPITIKFEDVKYSVTIDKQTSWFEFKEWGEKSKDMLRLPVMCGGRKDETKEKKILHGISGVVKPGEILAMLGPSGSGKTSLLNILGGRGKGRTGEGSRVLYNDLPYTRGMKRRTGFVTQDDVLLPHLTVSETLVYAAYLRLPSKEFTKAAKAQRAEDVIAELGLEKCKDTIIGGPFLRGISGGERKRVSIGHEMLIDPSLLLLDEPTSGLDSTIALKIVHTLQALAQGGRTVVTTIHQPSSIIFHTFNKLLLLSEGRALYYGAGPNAMAYFASIGYQPSFQTNPADFLLDLASGITYDASDIVGTKEMAMGGEMVKKDTSSKGKDFAAKEALLNNLREAYNIHLLDVTRKSMSQSAQLTEEEFKASQEKREWPSTWLEQVSVLMNRGVKERRHDVFSGLRVVQVIVMSLICGMLWWQSSTEKLQDQVGLLFFVTTFWGFFPVFTSLFTFPAERQMLMKERKSGMYRLSAYFTARILGDLPLELIMPTGSVTMIYWMGGLKPTVGAYFASLFTILLTVLGSQGLGLCLGAVFMDIKQASTLSSVLLLTFQLAGGFFVQATPIWIGWLKYCSFAYYSFKLQIAAQYTDTETYPCPTGRCRIVDYPFVKNIGANGVATSVMALALMAIGYRCITYFALRRMKL